MSTRRRAAVVPLYFDDDDNDDFDTLSQNPISQRAETSSKKTATDEGSKDDDSLLEENAFARYKLKNTGGSKLNPLQSLKNSQPVQLPSDLVAPAQKAASQSTF
jgi:hypothetical protein